MYKENLQNVASASESILFASSSQEIARVLKPKGRYLFLEHIHAPKGCALHWQQKALKGKFGVAAGCVMHVRF